MPADDSDVQRERPRTVRYAIWVAVPALFLVVFVALGMNWPTALGIEVLVCAVVFARWLIDSRTAAGPPAAPPTPSENVKSSD